jgi:hypothetical protein
MRFPGFPAACRVLVLAVSGLLTAATAWAGGRPNDGDRSWFGDISIGWAFPQGDADDILEDDWTLGGGVLYWPSEWPVGIQVEATWAEFDFSDEALDAINEAIQQDPQNGGRVDDGDVEALLVAVNGIWSPGNTESGFYVVGGVGAYFVDATVTNTQLVYFPPICDPWYWWWCIPGRVGPGSVVQGSASSTEYGFNAGFGYDFPAGEGKFFVEAKYHYVSTDSEDMYFLPITFGYRW